MMRFRDVFGRCEAGSSSQLEAAALLGVGERTLRRWCRRFENAGEAGLLDRRLGKPSPKRVPWSEAERVERLYRERDAGFTVADEGTMSSFRRLGEVFDRHGLPCALYTDRGSH